MLLQARIAELEDELEQERSGRVKVMFSVDYCAANSIFTKCLKFSIVCNYCGAIAIDFYSFSIIFDNSAINYRTRNDANDDSAYAYTANKLTSWVKAWMRMSIWKPLFNENTR